MVSFYNSVVISQMVTNVTNLLSSFIYIYYCSDTYSVLYIF